MKKFLIAIVIILIVIVAGVYIARNTIAKAGLSAGIRSATGLEAEVEGMNVDIPNTLVGIEKLRIMNPPGFGGGAMVDIPEVYVDYDLAAFFKKKVHLEKVRLNLQEFVVVKNEKGELNVNSLKMAEGEKAPSEEKEEEKEKGEPLEFQIDILELKIGKVVYKDYSQGDPPKVKEFNVNVDARYENIDDPNKLVKLIVVKALMNTALASLASFDVGEMQKEVTAQLDAATKGAQETVDQTREAATKALQEQQDQATSTMKDMLKLKGKE